MENIYGYVKRKNETAHVIASQGCLARKAIRPQDTKGQDSLTLIRFFRTVSRKIDVDMKNFTLR